MTDPMTDALRTRDNGLAESARLATEHAADPLRWAPMDVRPLLPRVLPVGWSHQGAQSSLHPHIYVRGGSTHALLVIVSAMRHDTGAEWLHVSASYRDRVPPWATMCELKDLFVGVDRVAVQVHPRREAHVNVHPHCLHLWARLDADAVPDFRTLGQV